MGGPARSKTKLHPLIWARSHSLQRSCKEVALWKNFSHPNVHSLIGVPNTLEDRGFSVVSEWMVNGHIIEYVRRNAGNHMRLVCYPHISLCHC